MRLLAKILNLLFLVIMVLSITDCKRETMTFEGRVVNFKNEGLSDAEVEIEGTKTKTLKDGSFTLNLKKSDRNKFQVNARKNGYATYSQSHSGPAKNLTLTLYEATVVSVDPTHDITVRDANSRNRPGSLTAQADWSSNPMAAVPLVVRNGKIVDIGFPDALGKAFEYLLNREPGPGISITIPANSLVNASTQSAPTGNLSVAVSTIDLFSPDAMPGDFAVSRNDREAGYLISYGAGFISVYDEKNQYQLKKGASAKISIPVDKSQLVLGDSLPPTIPLYLFDESSGTWTDHGEGKLNEDRSAYEGEVRHFSTFNMDIEKNNPACLGFQYTPASAAPTGFSYKVEVLVPVGGNIIKRTRTISEPGDCLDNPTFNTGAHVLLRLPPSTDVGLVFIDNTNNPLAILVTESSPAYDPALPPACTPAGYENPDASVSCPSLSWDVISDPIVAVGVSPGGVNQIKWVYRGTPAATGYRVVAADGSCNPVDSVDVAGTQTSTPLSLGGLILVQAEVPAGPGTYIVQALNGSTVVGASTCVQFF